MPSPMHLIRETRRLSLEQLPSMTGQSSSFFQRRASVDLTQARRLTKLDNWKTGILLAIKRQIAEEPSLT